jgi:hypothetical protein
MTDTDPRSIAKTLVPAAIAVIIVVLVFNPGGGLSMAKSDPAKQYVESNVSYKCGFDWVQGPEVCTADIDLGEFSDGAYYVEIAVIDRYTNESSEYRLFPSSGGMEIGTKEHHDVRMGDRIVVTAVGQWAPTRIVLADHEFTCEDSVDGCEEASSA